MVCTKILHFSNQSVRTLLLQGFLARKKKELDSIQPSHLTVLSAVSPRQRCSSLQQKGKTVVANTVREAVLNRQWQEIRS